MLGIALVLATAVATPQVSFLEKALPVDTAPAVICAISPTGAPVRAVKPGGPFDSFAWSRDGRSIAISSHKGRRGWLELMRPDGRARRVIARGHGSFEPAEWMQPAWSPNGRLIAFIENGSVFVSRTDGSHRRRIAQGGLTLFKYIRPSWSPDGSRLYFYSLELGPISTRLLSARPDGTDVRAEQPRADYGSDIELRGLFSPDRTKRAWSEYREGRVVVADAAPSLEFRPLTAAAGPDATDSLAWSPDSAQLAYVGRRPYKFGDTPVTRPGDIYAVGLDGAPERQLTATPTDEEVPAWRAGAGRSFGLCLAPKP